MNIGPIETNIPLPIKKADGASAKLRELDVGQSRVFSTEGKSAQYRNVLYSAAKAVGISIAIRTLEDGNFRVWRVA